MVRAYKRRPNTRRGRRIIAADLRAKGLSIREIAKILGCSVGTVFNDLEATAQTVQFPVQNMTPGGEELNAELNTSGIISLSAERFARRQA